MDKKKPSGKNTQDPRFKHLDMDMTNAAASMDFTGLIPAILETDGELDSYKEVHDFGNETTEKE